MERDLGRDPAARGGAQLARLLVQVAAVARVPPAMLQLMVAPEWEVVGGGGIDVPGLEGD